MMIYLIYDIFFMIQKKVLGDVIFIIVFSKRQYGGKKLEFFELDFVIFYVMVGE